MQNLQFPQFPQFPQFAQLPGSERLVVITLRAHLDDRHSAACVETLYRIACGLSWMERAVASFEAMVGALQAGSRRPFLAPDLSADRVSPDERCLLRLLAAHQLGARAHMEAGVAWLVRPEFHQTMQRCAAVFAHTLARSGCALSTSWIHADEHAAGPLPAVGVGNRARLAWAHGPRLVEEANG
jgi:hypothetical protein